MARSLPPKPSIRQLKIQAKNLLKGHKRGDVTACGTLKVLHRFSGLTSAQILESPVSLRDVQFAIALSYGFRGWEQLARHVESVGTGRSDARITNRDIAYFRDLLTGQLAELLSQVENAASSTANQSVLLAAEKTAKRLESALERIEDGTFGICEKCGEGISLELLRTRPTWIQCGKCSNVRFIYDLDQLWIEKALPGALKRGEA